MDPLTIGVIGVSALSALAQYYQSEKARGAAQDRLNEIKAEFDRIKPPEYNMTVMDPPQMIASSPPLPNFDMSDLSPETFKLIGQYNPEMAPYIQEARPDLVRDSAEGLQGKDAMMQALNRLRGISQTGEDPQMQAMIDQASRQSQIDSQSRRESILQDLAQKGMLTSGASLAADLEGASGDMQRSADTGRDAAVAAYMNKLQALKDSANLGRQVRGDDINLASKNADIINQFNQRTAARWQTYEEGRADRMNEGQQYNLRREQAVADANVEARNAAAFKNRNRRDDLMSELYRHRLGERDRRDNIAEMQGKWRQSERDRIDNLKQRGFNNTMDLARGRHGIAGSQMNLDILGGQDRNAAIQGGSDALTKYLLYLRNNPSGADPEVDERQGMTEDYRPRGGKTYGSRVPIY